MPIDWNLLLKNPDFFIFPMFFSFGLIALGMVIAIQWRKVRESKYNTYLKERLVERGFSADEIISVVNAGERSGRAREGRGLRAFYKASTCCC